MDMVMERDEKSEPSKKLHVGLTYNLKNGEIKNETNLEDEEAEYDDISTVLSIKKALEEGNYQVTLLEATKDLPLKLINNKFDIIFNIAEGILGRGREAQVPAILNFYRIPYTGSDETTLCIALDKALTKRILSTYGIRTPKYQKVAASSWDSQIRNTEFDFPVIVKPNAEGSSKGISDVAIVSEYEELSNLIHNNITLYKQDMLIEEYVEGREFTVGILGNGNDVKVFSPMEIVYLNKNNQYNIYSYKVKQNYKELIGYECPANINKDIETEMIDTARKVYEVLECRDFARVDFRIDVKGKVHFIEINPLPGLAPGYSDFPMIAEYNGMDYNSLVQNIIKCALNRYSIIPE